MRLVPFTGSHPAAVLPLMRWGLVQSGLVIGSMSPDLPYYLPMPVGAATTHSAPGVVTVDVLYGLAAFLVWHALFAPAAVAVAPQWVRSRLPESQPHPAAWHFRTPRATLAVLASVAVGAATHVAWDEFTHAGRWGARHIGWLREQHGALPGHRWAQYASGVIGAAVIVAVVIAWCRRTPPTPRPRALSTAVTTASLALVVAAAIVGAVVRALPAVEDGINVRRAAFLAVTGGCTAAVAAAAGLALVWRIRTSRARSRAPSAHQPPLRRRGRRP